MLLGWSAPPGGPPAGGPPGGCRGEEGVMGLVGGSGTVGWGSGAVSHLGWGRCWDGRRSQFCGEWHFADGAPVADTQEKGKAIETQIMVVALNQTLVFKPAALAKLWS